MTSSFQLYRGTMIGQSLYHALFDLVEAGKLSEELSEKVLAEFDKSMYHALEERVVEKRAVIKAGPKNYRCIDNVLRTLEQRLSRRADLLEHRSWAASTGHCAQRTFPRLFWLLIGTITLIRYSMRH
eukprot:evm.model.scf_1384.4 EVM.evm.TU.scf_1384.4   scf_1384:23537-23917(-)